MSDSSLITPWLEKRFMGSQTELLLRSPWNDMEKLEAASHDKETCSKIIKLFPKSGYRLKMRLLLEELSSPKPLLEKEKSGSSMIDDASPSDFDLPSSRHYSTTSIISDISHTSSPDSSPRTSTGTPPSLDLSSSLSRGNSLSSNSPPVPSSPSMSYLSSIPLASPASIGSRPVRSTPVNFVGPPENFPRASSSALQALPHNYVTIFKDTPLPVLSSTSAPQDIPPATPPRPLRLSLSKSPTSRPGIPPRPSSRSTDRLGFQETPGGSTLGQLAEEPESSIPDEQLTS